MDVNECEYIVNCEYMNAYSWTFVHGCELMDMSTWLSAHRYLCKGVSL